MSETITQLWRKVARKSPREVTQHVAKRVVARLRVHELDFPLLSADVADSAERPALEPRTVQTRPGTLSNRLAWVVVPPGPGSGGHTTLFRMMEASREAGYANTLLFYDRYNSDFESNCETIRSAWPWLTCDIEAVGESLDGFDAVVASSWATAHVVATRKSVSQPAFYFIQDFEPYFYARGSDYALAEDSYRLGLTNIALGHMVQDCLRHEVGVESQRVPFGCDTDVYKILSPQRERSGVLFYAKEGNARRGYTLAVQALKEFHRLHPEEPIHVYGDSPKSLPFPVIAHGSLSPEELNVLYNQVVSGLALSFTNISLVAEEMIAAGVTPVINDTATARADLHNPNAIWAAATPLSLANALSQTVRRPDRSRHASATSASVTTSRWQDTGHLFAEIVLESLGDKHA